MNYIIFGGVVFMENNKLVDGAQTLNPFLRNIQVTNVFLSGYLDEHGIKTGDRLVQLDDEPVIGLKGLAERLAKKPKSLTLIFNNNIRIKSADEFDGAVVERQLHRRLST
jgi:C-terminal processing protease CtpA/Prc